MGVCFFQPVVVVFLLDFVGWESLITWGLMMFAVLLRSAAQWQRALLLLDQLKDSRFHANAIAYTSVSYLVKLNRKFLKEM